MPIVVNLDVMMAKRKMSLNELAERVDVTVANLSVLKNNHAKAVRFTTLEATCRRWTASREIFWNMCPAGRSCHESAPAVSLDKSTGK